MARTSRWRYDHTSLRSLSFDVTIERVEEETNSTFAYTKKKKTATSALYRKVSESAKCSRLFFQIFHFDPFDIACHLYVCQSLAPSLLSPSPSFLRSSVTVISFSLFFSLFLFFLSPCFLLFRSPRPREMHKGPAASTHRKSQSSPAEVSFVLGALKVTVDWSRGVQRAAAMTRKAAGFCL